MQQVVLNRAAAELDDQLAAAAAEAGEEDQEQEEEQGAAQGVQMDAQSKFVAEGEEAPRAPRVVVLGKLTPAISTAQRAGEVVVVRPSHLQATAAGVPVPQPQVVLLPASTRKTPAPSAAKRASTPATGRTPATAGRGAATPGAALAAAGKTPASAVRTAGIPVLPTSMLKECSGVVVVAWCGWGMFKAGLTCCCMYSPHTTQCCSFWATAAPAWHLAGLVLLKGQPALLPQFNSAPLFASHCLAVLLLQAPMAAHMSF
jgi:hypothetical protein